LKLLAQDGFHQQNGQLIDRDGHLVEFSLVTGAGTRARTHGHDDAGDLSKIGHKLNVVTLDFPSLIERITRTFDYEACLPPDQHDAGPDAQMNVC